MMKNKIEVARPSSDEPANIANEIITMFSDRLTVLEQDETLSLVILALISEREAELDGLNKRRTVLINSLHKLEASAGTQRDVIHGILEKSNG